MAIEKGLYSAPMAGGGRSAASNRRRERERQEEPRSAYDLLMESELAQRLGQASPLEREIYDLYGLEPGLDRAAIFPYSGSRSDGNLQLAAPEFLYSMVKTLSAPGAALRGTPVSTDEAVETAMNTMGGGLGISSPVEGAVAGMAVKPKGGVFYPHDINESSLNSYLGGLQAHLRRYAGQDLDWYEARSIADKARKYLTTTYGTVDDPLRIAMLEGRLEEPTVRDYLIEAARRDYANRGRKSRRSTPGAENPGVSNAMEDFEKYYDSKTGIGGLTVDDADLAVWSLTNNDGGVGEKIKDPLIAAGVPQELINTPYVNTVRTDSLRTDLDKKVNSLEKLGSRASSSIQNRIQRLSALLGMDPSQRMLATAAEKGDIIYDMLPEHKFLETYNFSRGLQGIPKDKLSKMSFPEMVIAADRNNRRYGDLDAAVERVNAGKAIPSRMWLQQGVEPIMEVGDSQWVQIKDPEFTRLESAHMGHSVQNYALDPSYGVGTKGSEAIRDGTAELYSLRDSETGLPRITIEVSQNNRPDVPWRYAQKVTQIKGKQNKPPSKEDYPAIFQLFEKLGFDKDIRIEEINWDMDADKSWSQLYADYLASAESKRPYKATGGLVTMPSNYSKGRWRLI